MVILNDLLVIFGISMAVLYVGHRLRIPSIVGFLLTGMLAGPSGLGWISQIHEVELLAEIGVILLLFSIGIEFSLAHLVRIRASIWLAGVLQVALTIGVTAALLTGFRFAISPSLFAGFVLALSSTAIVLRLYQERAEMHSPVGRIVLSILIFQDIIIVPLMLLTPLLGQELDGGGTSVAAILLKGGLIILLVLTGARYAVPALLHQVIRTRSRELFLLTILTICVSITWLTSTLGLSLGLGAFLAGLIISESEYSDHALGGILPFRDVFLSFFFVSVGMLLDISYSEVPFNHKKNRM